MEPTKTVSILKEKWDGDVRVILVPDAIPLFTQSGFRVLVESGAGAGLGYADCAYADQGAKIVDTEAAWTESSYVVKYKAPHPSEYCYFRAGLTLGAFVYLEHDPALARRFCDTGMTLYGLTYFRSPSGNFPMIVSCNELSGKMAVLYGAYHLQNNHGGRGMLLSRIPGAEQPNVLVIGYGNVGGAAARLANDMGCSVTCLGTDPERLRKFEGTMPHTVRCLINTPDVLRHELSQADLVIGAIQISTYDTPPMIDRGMLKLMKPGAVIVDVTCGYGPGYLPTFH
ncbi:MAG: NAD(P)-dependent oxidoreductase, partial [Nitratireductor sp.]